MLETCQDQVIKLWPSVRAELLYMSYALPLMYHDAGASNSEMLFSSDAMGVNKRDNGGFGISFTRINELESKSLLTSSEQLGRTIAQLDGDFSGLRCPEKEITPTIPFTLLPDELFSEQRWNDLTAGRWSFPDHVTLGEARAVARLVQILAVCNTFCRKLVFSLQDNAPCSSSMTKGRSPSWALNYVLRRKSAACLVGNFRLLLPWVESKKQPSDALSRLFEGELQARHQSDPSC